MGSAFMVVTLDSTGRGHRIRKDAVNRYVASQHGGTRLFLDGSSGLGYTLSVHESPTYFDKQFKVKR